MTAVEVFAPAKVNLTLHVTGQRADGYHLIDSLVAFAGVGDRLTLTEAEAPSFTVTGPFADAVPHGEDNLVLRAARLIDHERPVAITLEKLLPPSSGIGGGSADAAAAFRGMMALAMARAGRPDDAEAYGEKALRPHWDTLLALGADVPMCLFSRHLRARGVGERIDLLDDLPLLPALLVNPRRAMPTPPVFAALAEKSNPPMPGSLPDFAAMEDFVDWLSEQRNDLQAPAQMILPEIADVTAALSDSAGALLARMSGSGATCFGLYRDRETADAAAARLASEHPDWWIRSVMIGGQSARSRPVFVSPFRRSPVA